MKKLLLFLTALVVIVLVGFYWTHPLSAKVTIDGHTTFVDVAITEAEKEQGLSGRSTLAKDHGMLFVYETKDRYAYWMKGMEFPLDFIWILDNTVVDLSANIPAPATPDAPPVTLTPKTAVNKVLEVPAGTIVEDHVKIGDTVRLSE